MAKYVQTVVTISVHAEGVNPIFGEGATHVSLKDEAGGYFIELRQTDDDSTTGAITLDPDEWTAIDAAVKQLLENAPKEL